MIIKNKIICSIFIAIFSVVICFAKQDAKICIEISLGKLKGSQLESRSGDKFWAFRGVPYAKPPIGELRFQNPQPINSWRPKIYDATKDSPLCPQKTANLSTISEDCLHLNVFTKDTTARKSVIVYIYPGGYYLGAANSQYAGPEYFMDRDIVLVTLNYRLGSLGFLATGTAEASGNMGLKDQVIALRWIQQHIEKFGGDPNSVTLWGYSAGAFSIGLHMMSPMAKGLFHKAIMMSFSPLGQFKYKTTRLDSAEKQAELLKCPKSSIQDMVKCLKAKPMMEFVNTIDTMLEIGWSPVVENNCDGNYERFLIEDPYTLMSKGDIYKVPIITGIAEYEFYYMAYYTLNNATIRQYFNDNFGNFTSTFFLYESKPTPKSLEASAALRSFYLQNKTLEFPQSLIPYSELFSDAAINFQYYRFVQMVSKYTPVYTYLFTYKGRYSYTVKPGTMKILGAMHQDELLYLLNVRAITPEFKKTDPENDTIERLTRFFYEFAKKSNPNNATDDYLKVVNWPLYTKDKQHYLEIGQNLNVKSNGIYPERLQLWDRLFPISEMLSPNRVQCKV